jgi:hypothetical protein
MKLYLHCGLPRTGTTTIQSHLFQHNANFLGKVRASERTNLSQVRDKMSREFVEIVNLANLVSPEKSLKVTLNWLERYKSNFGCTDCVISNEDLFAWNTTESLNDPWPLHKIAPQNLKGTHPLVTWLSVAGLKVFGAENLFVSLVTRDMSSWLASLYAKNSRNYLIANQNDFQSRVRLLKREGRIDMDITLIFGQINNLLGAENTYCCAMSQLFENKESITQFSAFHNVRIDMSNIELPKTNSYQAEEGFKIRTPPNIVFKKKFSNRYYKALGNIEVKLVQSACKFLNLRDNFILQIRD